MDQLNLVQLKALAYDILAQSQALQSQLTQVNKAIAEKSQAAAAAAATPEGQPSANTF